MGLRGSMSTYNLKEDVASRERLSLFLLPLSNATLCHCRAHSWHAELGESMSPRRGMEF